MPESALRMQERDDERRHPQDAGEETLTAGWLSDDRRGVVFPHATLRPSA